MKRKTKYITSPVLTNVIKRLVSFFGIIAELIYVSNHIWNKTAMEGF